MHSQLTTCPRSFSLFSGLPFCPSLSTVSSKAVYAPMRIHGDRVPDHRGPRHLVAVQEAQAAGSPEAWTTRTNLLPRTRNRRPKETRDGCQDSGQVLLWAASPITSLIAGRLSLGRLSLGQRRLRTIGNVYLGRHILGIGVRLLLLGMKIVERALLTLVR